MDGGEPERADADLRGDGTVGLARLWTRPPARVPGGGGHGARWGRLDVIVHAGILMPILPFEETSDDPWWRQLHVNLGGFYNAARGRGT